MGIWNLKNVKGGLYEPYACHHSLFVGPTNQMLPEFQSNNCFVMPFITEASIISSSNQPFMAQWPSAISFQQRLKKYLLPVT